MSIKSKNTKRRICFISALSMTFSVTVASATTCLDPDGDGWGWDGVQTCIPNQVAADKSSSGSCLDSDGDGYGWDGTQTCIPGASGSASTTPAEIEAENERLSMAPRFDREPDGSFLYPVSSSDAPSCFRGPNDAQAHIVDRINPGNNGLPCDPRAECLDPDGDGIGSMIFANYFHECRRGRTRGTIANPFPASETPQCETQRNGRPGILLRGDRTPSSCDQDTVIPCRDRNGDGNFEAVLGSYFYSCTPAPAAPTPEGLISDPNLSFDYTEATPGVRIVTGFGTAPSGELTPGPNGELREVIGNTGLLVEDLRHLCDGFTGGRYEFNTAVFNAERTEVVRCGKPANGTCLPLIQGEGVNGLFPDFGVSSDTGRACYFDRPEDLLAGSIVPVTSQRLSDAYPGGSRELQSEVVALFFAFEAGLMNDFPGGRQVSDDFNSGEITETNRVSGIISEYTAEQGSLVCFSEPCQRARLSHEELKGILKPITYILRTISSSANESSNPNGFLRITTDGLEDMIECRANNYSCLR